MEQLWQERSTQAAVAPVPSSSGGPARHPLPAWDRRTWLVAIPLTLIVIYSFIPILNNGFVPSLDDNQNFLENPYFRGLGAAQVKWAWTAFWVGAYQPLAWLLFERNTSSANSTREVITSSAWSFRLPTPWSSMS